MSTTTHRLSKVGLAAGFLGLLVAVVVAHGTPATGYELSIYWATPNVVWLGLGVAFAVGGVLALVGPRASRVYDGALLLVASAALTVFAMPVLRGYQFYGRGDSLSHLGWSREITTGAFDPSNLLYPGIHTYTAFVESVAGVDLSLAGLYVVSVVFPLVFLLFVPLTVQLLGGGRRGVAIGLLSAALFIPINNVSVHPVAHPSSQGILFLPFVLYLVLAYTIHTTDRSRVADSQLAMTDGGRGTSWWASGDASLLGLGALLALTSVAVVVIHPQQAVNVALAFVAVTAVQLAYRRWKPDHAIATHHTLTVQTVVLVAAILAWAPRFPRVRGAIAAVFGSILSRGATTGEVVTQRSASLTTIGGSLPELFLKLFLPALVFSVLAVWLVAAAVRRFTDDPDVNALVVYVAAALVPLFGVFLLMVAAASGDQYFRYVGFMMVPVTALGATALGRWIHRRDAGASRRIAAVGLVVLFAVLMPVGVAATHPSPHMYQPTSHVTESDFSGYSSAFEHRESDVAFTGVRGGPRRFVDAHYGTQRAITTLGFPGYRDPIREPVFAAANYSDAFDEPRYMPVTRSTYVREVGLYRGFRYSDRGFRALEATPNVNRVRSNDEFDLYRIEGGEDDA